MCFEQSIMTLTVIEECNVSRTDWILKFSQLHCPHLSSAAEWQFIRLSAAPSGVLVDLPFIEN